MRRLVSVEEAVALNCNVAIFAGAGCGKTHALVSTAMCVLAGARAGGEPVPCAQLGMVTFTVKAAGEMRKRLWRRLDALAQGQTDYALAAAFERAERKMPAAPFFRGVRDDLGSAFIGTFHAISLRLLERTHEGILRAKLLDERESRRIRDEAVRRVLLRRIGSGDVPIRDLVRAKHFGAGSGRGFAPELAALYAKMRDEGAGAMNLQLADAAQISLDLRKLVAAFAAQADAVRRDAPVSVRGVAAQVDLLVARLVPMDPLAPEFDATVSEIGALLKGKRAPLGRLRAFTSEKLADGLEESLPALRSALEMAPYEAHLRKVLEEVESEHVALLAAAGGLDFGGLLLRLRKLLVESPEARVAVQRRFRALLVDEFQDTNGVQLQLVRLLSELRSGAPRNLASVDALVPLEPNFLAVVGDRKQAIYGFRGARESVLELFATEIESNGGARCYLRESYRASPMLAPRLNALIGRVASSPAVEEGDEALKSARLDEPPGAAVLRLSLPPATPAGAKANDLRTAEAWEVARIVRAATTEGLSEFGGSPVRGEDIALLFQRSTNLDLYANALTAWGVRFRVEGGRGFYSAQEVVDVRAFLRLVVEPTDAHAFAVVARSPFVGLSDAALSSLAVAPDAEPGTAARGLRPEEVLVARRTPEQADARELARLAHMASIWRVLRASHEQLGLASCVRMAIEETGYRWRVAATPGGDQALANLVKFESIAAAHQDAFGGVREFLSELASRETSDSREAPASLMDATEKDAVILSTVHQAKGLEWPIVILPELAAAPPVDQRGIAFASDSGFALEAMRGAPSATFARIRASQSEKEKAERMRLLYVAITRARDRLVLGVLGPRARKGTWAASLESANLEAIPTISLEGPSTAPPGTSQGTFDDSAARAAVARARRA